MIKRKKMGLLIVIAGFAFIAALFIKLINDDIDVEGWQDFKGNIKKEYDFVGNIAVASHTPITTFISFSLKRDCRVEDLIPIFEKTRKYILSKDVLTDLQELHKSRFKTTFDEIIIEYSFFDDSSDYYSQFQFSSIVYDDLRLGTWSVERNHESLGEYSDGAIIKYERRDLISKRQSFWGQTRFSS